MHGCRGRGGAPFLCFSFVLWRWGTLLSALFYPFFRRVVVGSPWSGVFVGLGVRVCFGVGGVVSFWGAGYWFGYMGGGMGVCF